MSAKAILASALSLVILAACNKDDDDTMNTDDDIDVAQETYNLPGDSLFPEGIAYRAGYFYTGSVTNGDILKVNVESGAVTTWAQGAPQGRRAATGMKMDAKNRLWVCGGEDAKVAVISEAGALVKLWDMKALFGAGFINDCISDGTHMYFTDSRVRKVYRAPVSDDNPTMMEEWLAFDSTQIPYTMPGTNANGIVVSPDGQYLIMVVSTSGKLYRIRKSDGSITEVVLNTPVTSGDGLLLEGATLYVSRNATNQIWPVQMSSDYAQGTVGMPLGTGLLFNTTMARAEEYMLVVNGQLNKRTTNDPVLPFTVRRLSF